MNAPFTPTPILSSESVSAFMKQGTESLQSTAAQLRLWACPDLDPKSPESRNIAGETLDEALSRIAFKICESRVSAEGVAYAGFYTSLQSVLRNAWPQLNGKGAGVSVRFLECKVDEDGNPTKPGIKATSAYLGAKNAKWSRIGRDQDGGPQMARFACIMWKQGISADILDPTKSFVADPGGDNDGTLGFKAQTPEEQDHELQYQPSNHHLRDTGVRFTPEAVAQVIREQRGQAVRESLSRKSYTGASSVIANCWGEGELMLKAAAMVRWGLIEAPSEAPADASLSVARQAIESTLEAPAIALEAPAIA